MRLFDLIKQKLGYSHKIVIKCDPPKDDTLIPEFEPGSEEVEDIGDKQFRAIQAMSALRSLGCKSGSDLKLIVDSTQSSDQDTYLSDTDSLVETQKRITAAHALIEMQQLGCETLDDLAALICAEPI